MNVRITGLEVQEKEAAKQPEHIMDEAVPGLQQADIIATASKESDDAALISAARRIQPEENFANGYELIAEEKQKTLICPVHKAIPKEKLKSAVARLKVTEQKFSNSEVPVNNPVPLPNPEVVSAYSSFRAPTESAVMTKYQPTEFVMENYSYHDGALFYIDEAHREIKIANFWLQIVAENDYILLLGDSSNKIADTEVTAKWKVKIFCSRRCFDAELSRVELENSKLLNEKTLGRGKIEKPALFSEFIGRLIDREEYNQQYFYLNSGWILHPQFGWLYMTNDGPIGIQGTGCYAKVPYDFEYNKNAVGTRETFQAFWNMRFVCSGTVENSVFLMHFSCVATMASLFQHSGFPISFVVALIGSTNSMKTSCAKVFTRMFQAKGTSGVDMRFSSTLTAIEEAMEMYGDAILTVDDYLPYEDKSSRYTQRAKLDAVIRSYGDHEPKKRSKIYAKINEVPAYTPIRGCCLITGETIDFTTESSATRVIKLGFERGQVDKEKLRFYQENPLIFPTFLYDYICYIREHIQDIESLIRTSTIAAQMGCQNIKTPRYKEVYGVMSVGVSSFYQYAVVRGFLDMNEAEVYSREDLRMIEKIILQNDRDVKEASPAAIICLALEKAIREGSIPVIRVCDADISCELIDAVVDDGEFLRIYPETLCALYIQYCKCTGRNIIFRNGKELHSPLKKENLLLLKEGSDGLRSAHKIKGKSERRFFFIRKDELQKFTDFFCNF